MQSKSTQLVFVYEAGPCGYWLSRSLTTKRPCLLGGGALLDPHKALGSGSQPTAGTLSTGLPRCSGAPSPRSTFPRWRRKRGGIGAGADRPPLCSQGCEGPAQSLAPGCARLPPPGRATWSPAHFRGLSEVGCPTRGTAERVPSIRPRGHRPHRMAGASGTSPHSPGAALVARPGRRGSPGATRGAMHGRSDHGGRTRRPVPGALTLAS